MIADQFSCTSAADTPAESPADGAGLSSGTDGAFWPPGADGADWPAWARWPPAAGCADSCCTGSGRTDSKFKESV